MEALLLLRASVVLLWRLFLAGSIPAEHPEPVIDAEVGAREVTEVWRAAKYCNTGIMRF